MKSKHIAFGLLFVCGALLCGLVALYSSIRAANRVGGLTPVTVAVLQDRPLGEEVLVEGRVSSRNPVRSESTGFVAYVREWREITYDDEGRPDPGNWSVSERVTPPLLLELSDALLQIENDDYDIEDALVVDEREPGEGPDEFSTRIKGITSGDDVIAVGVVSARVERPQITADFIARGTRASYVARRRWGGAIFCAGSILVCALGATVLFWDRVGRLLSRLRSAVQRAWKGTRRGENRGNG
jgi:hypothetical protein